MTNLFPSLQNVLCLWFQYFSPKMNVSNNSLKPMISKQMKISLTSKVSYFIDPYILVNKLLELLMRLKPRLTVLAGDIFQFKPGTWFIYYFDFSCNIISALGCGWFSITLWYVVIVKLIDVKIHLTKDVKTQMVLYY